MYNEKGTPKVTKRTKKPHKNNVKEEHPPPTVKQEQNKNRMPPSLLVPKNKGRNEPSQLHQKDKTQENSRQTQKTPLKDTHAIPPHILLPAPAEDRLH